MGVRLLVNEDVRAFPASAAVEAMRLAVLAAHAGRLTAPPRVRAELRDLDYVFTVGALKQGPTGFRAYRVGTPAGDQLTAVWDTDGNLDCVVIGDELGARRTGALGAVAADALARAEARTVAVIGSGHQAWTQLWALTAVRKIDQVRVYSPNRGRRTGFAERASSELGLRALAVDTAQSAVSEADILILATRSASPVIDAADVKPGAHVVTVGPKTVDGHETPFELADRASVITCDSPAQAESYGSAFFTGGRPLVDLGLVVSGSHPGRQSAADITLHCSVGLAGTEVLLAHHIARAQARSLPR